MTQVLMQLFTRWQGASMADSQMHILQACMHLTRLVQPVNFKMISSSDICSAGSLERS